jgi:CYTH domain-containing protein
MGLSADTRRTLTDRSGADAVVRHIPVSLRRRVEVTMADDDGKYTRIEYERRFFVRPESGWRETLEPAGRSIDDTYLRGTRLRLRVIRDLASGDRTIKLTKKDESPSPFYRTLSRILLTPAELRLFERLDGDRLTKLRRHCTLAGRRYAVDAFDGELAGLLLCEVEATGLDDLMRAPAPPFSEREVTEDPFFDGANLARTARAELLAKIASFRAS